MSLKNPKATNAKNEAIDIHALLLITVFLTTTTTSKFVGPQAAQHHPRLASAVSAGNTSMENNIDHNLNDKSKPYKN